MNADTFVKAQLAAHAYHQAGASGSLESMRAVCFIHRNRVRGGWAGGDWMETVNRAWVHDAFEPKVPQPISMSDELFGRLLMHIDEIYNGQTEDKLTEKGLYYINTLDPRAPREWFRKAIIQDPHNHPRVAQVGMIAIYR